MEGRGFLLLCGLVVSYCVAQNPNPECDDLVALKKNIESAFKYLGKLSCTPNTNCTGLTCSGTRKGKSFKGTVILQGCQKPVTLFVHLGSRNLLVKNGQRIQLRKSVYIDPQITKEGNVVHITLTLKTCLSAKASLCVPFKILNDQKVHVYCNGSRRVVPDPSWIPKKRPGSTPPAPYPESKKGSKNTKQNCIGVNSAEESIERNFGVLARYIFPGSTISCNPIANCTGLNCTGVVYKPSQEEHFTTSAIVDYCSRPATLKLHIDVPKENMHFDHIFRDGEKVEVSKEYKLYITVHLKRQTKYINVTVTGTGTVGNIPVKRNLIKNAIFPIDPSHCHGYHAPGQEVKSNAVHSKGRSLTKGAIAGIIVASLMVVALLAAFGVWLVKTKRLSARPAIYNNVMMSDDTDPLYNDFEPVVA